jgi:dTDP-4-dehydrorhamnose reductase
VRVLVLGASGIVGQHLRLQVPPSITPIWHRRQVDSMHVGCDLTDAAALRAFLDEHRPETVVNLSGQNDVDAVEQDPTEAHAINVAAVALLASWCREHGARLVQASSQAVFDGSAPPYGPDSPRKPINAYGIQRVQAEQLALEAGGTVVRLTFVLGVRPMPYWGRPNPVEQILAGQRKQVNDRWFSPLFADDAARGIWAVVVYGEDRSGIVHLGNPQRMSRYDVAVALGASPEPISHDGFPGIAARPADTAYAWGRTGWFSEISDGIARCRAQWESRQSMGITDRVREIALFFGITEEAAGNRLQRGFGAAHADVGTDFKAGGPKDDAALLEWYRRTESYIWELSAYHLDAGFNYAGMCRGVADRLRASGALRVLCLGDGIGDLTLALRRAGMEATYHDLEGSRTAELGMFRLWRHTGRREPAVTTLGWAPEIRNGKPYDAVVCCDFLEHCTDVPAWAGAIKAALKPGGLLFCQNAFACGSGDNGSIPMHLARNDRFERDWDPMLAGMGFRQLSSNWYEVPA